MVAVFEAIILSGFMLNFLVNLFFPFKQSTDIWIYIL